MQDRPFDIILWGATGHTGRSAALYLQRQYGHQLYLTQLSHRPVTTAQTCLPGAIWCILPDSLNRHTLPGQRHQSGLGPICCQPGAVSLMAF